MKGFWFFNLFPYKFVAKSNKIMLWMIIVSATSQNWMKKKKKKKKTHVLNLSLD
jgi:hypothetical protein